MSQLIRLDDRAKVLEGVFRQNMKSLANVVPRTMGDPSRLLRIAYNNVAYDTALLECSATPQGMVSIFAGVMECLKLGLQIGGPMQEAWLIPFKQKGIPIATVIIGYQGYRNILDRGKSVIDLHPVAVHQGDEFDFELGSRPYVKHRPKLSDRGPLIAVYACAHLPRGGLQLEVMGKAEVDEHRAKSRAKDSGPWVDFYEAMALKTVVRKIAKYLPKSSEILARALDLDDRADRGVDQNLDIEGLVFDVVATGGVKQVGGTRLDALKQQLGAGPAALAPPPAAQTPAEPAAPAQALDPDEEREIDAQAARDEDPDAERIRRERAEIDQKIAEMERAEKEGRTEPAARPGPATERLFPSSDPSKPIGPAAAKEALDKIRAGAEKKGR